MKASTKAFLIRSAPDWVLNWGRYLRNQRNMRRCKVSVSVSQANQDYWIYGEAFNEFENGYFLDVGAHDGVYLSNTFLLEKRYKWKGICIEANPETFLNLARNRECKCINKCIDMNPGVVSFALRGVMGGIIAEDCDNNSKTQDRLVKIDTIPLEELLKQEGAPKVIDYFSIDIEGAEDRALLNFAFDQYRFNCLTIERPSLKLRALLASNGYILIREIPDLDCFYIHESFKAFYKRNLLDFGEKRFYARRWL